MEDEELAEEEELLLLLEDEALDVMLEETLDELAEASLETELAEALEEATALDDDDVGLLVGVLQSVVVMVDVGTSLPAAHEHSKANAKASASGDCFILNVLRKYH